MRCLIILVFIGLVGQTMGHKEFNLKLSEKLPLKDLLVLLGDRLPEQSGTESERRTKDANYVADLLAQAANKKSEIFNRLTIDQLLALNEWTVDDCARFRLENRRETCMQLCGQEEHQFLDEVLDEADQQMGGDKLVPYNLGRYCWHLFEQVKEKCPPAQLKDAKAQFDGWLNRDAWLLHSVNELVQEELETKRIQEIGDETGFKFAVIHVFTSSDKGSSWRSNVQKLCHRVVARVGEIPQDEKISRKLAEYFRICKYIISF